MNKQEKNQIPSNDIHSSISEVTTEDEFLDKLLQTDATLDEGTEPDLKVIDSDMNLMPPDLNAGSLLEFFNQLTSKTSSSLESFPIKEEPLSEEDLKVLQKDRQKKDNHNLIERRRRYNINDRIKELGTLLPKEEDQYFDLVRDVRQNKGSILKASVEYIKRLKQDQRKKNYFEEKYRLQDYQNKKLMQKLQEYDKKLRLFETQIKTKSVKPASSNMLKSSYSETFVCTHEANENIKKENYAIKVFRTSKPDMDDLMEDDSHPVSFTDPMLSSPTPSSTFCSSSPSSLYSSDENLSPESIDLLV